MRSTTDIYKEGVSFWAVFDSWGEEQAHAGFVKTLWRIGKAEPKINSLALDWRVDFL